MRPLAVTTWVLLCAPLLLSAEQRIDLTAVPGQDSVTLPCEAGKGKEITAVEWSRAGLVQDDTVLVFRDGRLESYGQHSSFKNRVDLQDRQMKDGDASLILKNVTTKDTGTYKCTVHEGGGNRRKRAVTETISSIHLVVSPPGRGHLALVLVLVASVLGIVAAVLIRKRKKTPPPPDEEAAVIHLVQTQSSDNSPPPPEGAPVQPLV